MGVVKEEGKKPATTSRGQAFVFDSVADGEIPRGSFMWINKKGEMVELEVRAVVQTPPPPRLDPEDTETF